MQKKIITTNVLGMALASIMLVSSPVNAATTKTATTNATTSTNAAENSATMVSQKFTGQGKVITTLNKVLPIIPYSTDNLSSTAKKVNSSQWQAGKKIDRNVGAKLQALLNWHNHGVGAVDGRWGKNTRKAMQAFQEANGLAVTDSLTNETWQALTQDSTLTQQPVLVNYMIKDGDVNIKTTTIPASTEAKGELEGMYYESVLEALAEKFHMDTDYLKALNPNKSFKSGETITIYNPGTPTTTAVSRVVADKNTQTLYAYDANDKLVASYPTTVGSTATPSPTGTHKVEVKVHEPNYTHTADDGTKTIIPPGANNPVGLVWIGLSKPTYGIHGSPDPERISRQASSGCVRLTNWDALTLYGLIDDDATVEFK
ncbi:L,D-transpeptidase family protein [Psychrobacter arenosus]|uniref:L,D-transpeptidase family protein n=1 Tax=Psychrobacter arenosus TaxID=256326 RepID=UPI001917E04B|nr:L,D-transpeptidase family protein [Psychrobacter arenosus]